MKYWPFFKPRLNYFIPYSAIKVWGLLYTFHLYGRSGAVMTERLFLSLPSWLKDIFADSFKKYLILLLCFIGLGIYTTEQYKAETSFSKIADVSFFFHPLCPHCQKQKIFNTYLKAKYPKLHWAEYDTSKKENNQLLAEFSERNDGKLQRIGVPRTFIGPYMIRGFNSAETTGIVIEKAIQAYIEKDPALFDEKGQIWQDQELVTLPFFGELKVTQYSLLSLAVILGLIDGFNPCAMWVLVYLISIIMTLRDRKKTWLLVGTFVGASGVLYFLFMTAWLNVFLFLGYIRILTLIIGLVAIGAGILNIREYLQTKGELVCKIGNATSKKKTMSQIDQIVQAPLTCFTVFGIIALAFVINTIEFACSAALPAIFTHTLSLHRLSNLQYYGYIIIYDFFFMLDDLVIFSLAVLALETDIGHRYAKYCKIIGGVVLLVLGWLMAFHPGVLR